MESSIMRAYRIVFSFFFLIHFANFISAAHSQIGKYQTKAIKKIPFANEINSVSKDVANGHRIQCIMDLKNKYKEEVGRFVEGKHAVLLDTVDHGNLGDSFIQVGEMKLMEDFNTPATRACSVQNCNFNYFHADMAKHFPNCVVLVHGGGNLGDFWREMAKFKNRIVRNFIKHNLVLLPQSIYYKKPSLARTDARVFRLHSKLHVLLRDYDSLNFSRVHFKGVSSSLCPDGAFYIGPIAKTCAPKWDVVFIARRDRERRKDRGKVIYGLQFLRERNVSALHTDWFSWRAHLGSREKPRDRLDWAKFHLDVATDFLCLGRVIVTDRLHATILSTLMGLPHVFLDNRSGKIQGYRSSNFSPRPDCQDKYLNGWPARSWLQGAEIAQMILTK